MRIWSSSRTRQLRYSLEETEGNSAVGAAARGAFGMAREPFDLVLFFFAIPDPSDCASCCTLTVADTVVEDGKG